MHRENITGGVTVFLLERQYGVTKKLCQALKFPRCFFFFANITAIMLFNCLLGSTLERSFHRSSLKIWINLTLWLYLEQSKSLMNLHRLGNVDPLI